MNVRRPLSSLALFLSFASVLLAQAPAWPREAENPSAPKPAPPPAALVPLIGEYEGSSGAHLYVLERDGRLWTILDRGEATPLNAGRDLIGDGQSQAGHRQTGMLEPHVDLASWPQARWPIAWLRSAGPHPLPGPAVGEAPGLLRRYLGHAERGWRLMPKRPRQPLGIVLDEIVKS